MAMARMVGCLKINFIFRATPRRKSTLLLHLPDNTHLREPRTNPSRNLAVTMPNDPEVPYVPPARLISGSLTALQVTAMFEGLFPVPWRFASTHPRSQNSALAFDTFPPHPNSYLNALSLTYTFPNTPRSTSTLLINCCSCVTFSKL